MFARSILFWRAVEGKRDKETEVVQAHLEKDGVFPEFQPLLESWEAKCQAQKAAPSEEIRKEPEDDAAAVHTTINKEIDTAIFDHGIYNAVCETLREAVVNVLKSLEYDACCQFLAQPVRPLPLEVSPETVIPSPLPPVYNGPFMIEISVYFHLPEGLVSKKV
mmetsp:Transcript_18664/g.30675  ORF Transcript_18664/g.30675 Transcript_18664/m.30675 type:complete len:163 (-) Transcript_18664:342-830(-)|eukprot:CAMPEP_0184656808 /NCGR_PEP_ID=MMETSP0308-20130426/16769_1 /TAXON_ID=38269 /ORGANISM="Gloeochaete witrockiana, Strain SAG 46.84" /LENGTH=162 /DNA_ID=CAMNT_0027094095 /DNA_START=133 /DNA_END=621 /DNA_ORIENTATION=-